MTLKKGDRVVFNDSHIVAFGVVDYISNRVIGIRYIMGSRTVDIAHYTVEYTILTLEEFNSWKKI